MSNLETIRKLYDEARIPYTEMSDYHHVYLQVSVDGDNVTGFSGFYTVLKFSTHNGKLVGQDIAA